MQWIGHFNDEEKAARAYDEMAKQLRADPILNFLPDGSLNPDRKKRKSHLHLLRPPHVEAPKHPSIYRGLRWDNGRWGVQIMRNGRRQHLGPFDDEEAAARAYDKKAKQLHASPTLNFLADGSLNPDRKLKRPLPVKEPKRPPHYRGLSWSNGRWAVAIRVKGLKQHLGTYDTEEEAARVYDEKAKQVLVNPTLNFLANGSLNPNRRRKRSLPVKAPTGPSTYRGVKWGKGRWQAHISVNDRQQYLGRFDTEEEAARAYDEKAKQLRANPVLNFLPDGSLNPDRKKAISYHRLREPPYEKAPQRASTYRGVSWRSGHWRAEINVNGRSQYVGIFDDKEAAARAHDGKAKQLHAHPILNFLPDGSLNPDRKKRAPRTSASRSLGATAVTSPPRTRGPRYPRRASAWASSSSASGAPAHGNSSGGGGGRRGDDEDDAVTTAIKEEETGGGDSRGSSSSSSSLRRRRVVKEEEEDAVTIGVKKEEEEDGEQPEDERGRRWWRRKRGRWGQQELMTVGIKKEEEL